ncbi:MAG TPA: ATP-dependent metallopeptidase FtsH/Yme1/Tma family protein, partial [Gammaproteobacteria bacterium]
MPPANTWIWFLLLLLLNFLLFRTFFAGGDAALTIPYTVFKEQVVAGNVAEIYNQGQRIEGRFIEPVTYPPAETAEASRDGAAEPQARRPAPRTGTTFETTLPTFVDPGLEALLIEHGVDITAEPIDTGTSPLGLLLFGFGPAILIIAFYVWLFRRAAR